MPLNEPASPVRPLTYSLWRRHVSRPTGRPGRRSRSARPRRRVTGACTRLVAGLSGPGDSIGAFV